MLYQTKTSRTCIRLPVSMAACHWTALFGKLYTGNHRCSHVAIMWLKPVTSPNQTIDVPMISIGFSCEISQPIHWNPHLPDNHHIITICSHGFPNRFSELVGAEGLRTSVRLAERAQVWLLRGRPRRDDRTRWNFRSEMVPRIDPESMA